VEDVRSIEWRSAIPCGTCTQATIAAPGGDRVTSGVNTGAKLRSERSSAILPSVAALPDYLKKLA
jgi:hypothetical protein